MTGAIRALVATVQYVSSLATIAVANAQTTVAGRGARLT